MRHATSCSLVASQQDAGAGASTDVFFSLRRREGPYRPCLDHNRRNPIKGTYIVTKARCCWGKRVCVYVWTPAIVLSQSPCFLPSAVSLKVLFLASIQSLWIVSTDFASIAQVSDESVELEQRVGFVDTRNAPLNGTYVQSHDRDP